MNVNANRRGDVRAGIDTSNTDPAYWEAILKNYDLSVERVEAQEVLEVSPTEHAELNSNDLGDPDDSGGYEPDSKHLPSESNFPTDLDATESDEFEQLRQLVDGDDEFMSWHQIVKIRKIERQINDEWFNDWKNVAALLVWKFPLVNSILRMTKCTCAPSRAKRRPRCLYCKHKKDREAAGRMAQIINLYFRSGLSNTHVAHELSQSGESISAEAIDQMVYRIRKDWELFKSGAKREDKRRKTPIPVTPLQIRELPPKYVPATDIV
jgi:hypothetical protein